MILNKRIFLFIIMLIPTVVLSQKNIDSLKTAQKGEQLKEVVVTATRTSKTLLDVAVPTKLITKEQIKITGTTRLNEILNEQTGIVIVPDESGFQGIQIQGLDADYILILIDGVPVIGRNSGNFDLRRLTIGNIKQVEVIKGPSSALYGSNALAGVVNIITENNYESKISGNASYQIARFNQKDFSLNLGQHINKLSYSGFVNLFDNDGYDLNPDEEGNTVVPFRNYTFNANFDYEFSDKFKLTSKNRYFNQLADASLFSDGIEYNSDSSIDELGIFLGATHKIAKKTKLFYEAYYTNYKTNEEFKNEALDSIIFENNFDQKFLRGEIRSQTDFNETDNLIIGAGYQYEFLDRTLFGNSVSFSSQYAFAQYDLKINHFLNAVAGFRFDNHSEYDNQLSPKIALNIQPSKNFRIKPSVGYGFKAPDFRQLYFDFTNPSVGYSVFGYNVAVQSIKELDEVGQIISQEIPLADFNNPLKAESSVGSNLVLSYEKRKLSTNVNLFYNDITDLIDTQIVARKTNGQNVFSYKNFNSVITYGLDFDVSYHLFKNTSLDLGYQLLFAYDTDKLDDIEAGNVFARNSEGESFRISKSDYLGLPNRSKHSANIKITQKIPTIGLSINARSFYRSDYGLFDTNGNGIIDKFDQESAIVDGYFLTNLSVDKKLNNSLNIQIGANNLLNYLDNKIPSLPGIQSYFKLNYKF